MNIDLINYVENYIFPIYSKNDEGHGLSHINSVIERSLKLAMDYNADLDMVYAIASFHDLGHHIDTKRHEIISAQMFMDDEQMKVFFCDEQRQIIKEAIEDHRSSGGQVPRSIYGKIVATADVTLDIDTCIKRAYAYGIKYFPDLSEDEHIVRIYDVLNERYGNDGCIKCFVPDPELEAFAKLFRDALADKDAFLHRIKNVIKADSL